MFSLVPEGGVRTSPPTDDLVRLVLQVSVQFTERDWDSLLSTSPWDMSPWDSCLGD